MPEPRYHTVFQTPTGDQHTGGMAWRSHEKARGQLDTIRSFGLRPVGILTVWPKR